MSETVRDRQVDASDVKRASVVEGWGRRGVARAQSAFCARRQKVECYVSHGLELYLIYIYLSHYMVR